MAGCDLAAAAHILQSHMMSLLQGVDDAFESSLRQRLKGGRPTLLARLQAPHTQLVAPLHMT